MEYALLTLGLITVKCEGGESGVHNADHFGSLQTGDSVEGNNSGADYTLLQTPLLPPAHAGKQLDAAAGLLHGDLRIKVLQLLYYRGTR